MSGNPSRRHALLVVSATACWGCGTVLSKQALDRGVAPLTLLAVELAASSSLLVLGAVVGRVRLRWSTNVARLAILGVINPGLAYALGLFGLVTINASLSVLVWATEPVIIMLLAVLILRERITTVTVVAVAIALVGAVLVLYRPGATGDVTGIGLTVAAVCACGFYTVFTRWLLLDDTALEVVLVQQLAALVFAVTVVGAAWATGVSELGLPTDPVTWGLAAGSGVIYYGLAFWLFIGGLRGVPASVAGSMFPLIPVFGLAAGYVVGDRLDGRQWLGATVVVLATTAAAWHQVARRPPARSVPDGAPCPRREDAAQIAWGDQRPGRRRLQRRVRQHGK